KKGAEHLPWLENHLSWISKDTAYWEKRLLRTQMETMLLSPDFVNDKETTAKVRQHANSLLSEDPEVIRKIQKFVTTWGLSGNIA
ncbi:hypothetical protein, partial [Erwinia amylovora]|uniref:hypothetical protein n=1 Tax=Erwinia amylovora TaxID=552 RepID=UPI0020C05F4C